MVEPLHAVVGVLTGSDHVLCRAPSIVNVREFTALEAVRFRGLLEPVFEIGTEVRVLDVLNKVGDQELPPVPMLRGAQPFRSVRALARVPLREDSTV